MSKSLKLIAKLVCDVVNNPYSTGVKRAARLGVSVSTYLRAKNVAIEEYGVKFEFDGRKLTITDSGRADFEMWRRIAEKGQLSLFTNVESK